MKGTIFDPGMQRVTVDFPPAWMFSVAADEQTGCEVKFPIIHWWVT